VPEIHRLIAANEGYAAARAGVADPRPNRQLAIVTCMDARIDVFAALGLHLGEALVLRNAGGRVTDDVLRSLALGAHVLGVDTVVVMQHTKCGIAGRSDAASCRSWITPWPSVTTSTGSSARHSSIRCGWSPGSSTTSRVGRSAT
jgi:carbonic anhydrase